MRVDGMRSLLLIFACLPLFLACSKSHEVGSSSDNQSGGDAKARGDTQVIALVDGTRITKLQLEQAMDRYFSSNIDARNRKDVEHKVLQSLISSRVISQLAKTEMSAEEREALDARVSAFREELLVKKYIQAHADPQPVTSEMVQAYYTKHKDEFGGGSTSSFEIVQTTRELDGGERKKVIGLFGELATVRDWQKWSEEHKVLPIGWRRLEAKNELLKQPLKQLVASTDVGKTSALHIDDRLTIVRVTDRKELPAKPLMQVSADIRRKLAPVKMKDAIKTISDQAEKQLKIEIVDQEYKGIAKD